MLADHLMPADRELLWARRNERPFPEALVGEPSADGRRQGRPTTMPRPHNTSIGRTERGHRSDQAVDVLVCEVAEDAAGNHEIGREDAGVVRRPAGIATRALHSLSTGSRSLPSPAQRLSTRNRCWRSAAIASLNSRRTTSSLRANGDSGTWYRSCQATQSVTPST